MGNCVVDTLLKTNSRNCILNWYISMINPQCLKGASDTVLNWSPKLAVLSKSYE